MRFITFITFITLLTLLTLLTFITFITFITFMTYLIIMPHPYTQIPTLALRRLITERKLTGALTSLGIKGLTPDDALAVVSALTGGAN